MVRRYDVGMLALSLRLVRPLVMRGWYDVACGLCDVRVMLSVACGWCDVVPSVRGW